MRKTGLRLCMVAAFAIAIPAGAQDAPKRPWSDVAEFGLVMTTGNSEGTNFSFANKFKYTWSNAELTFDAVALRTETTTRTLTNVGGVVVVTDTDAVTAASYALGSKYRRNITERFFWYVGTSWYQNFFAGIDDRFIVGAGVGYTFVNSERHTFKGDIGATFTREDPLGNPPPVELETENFAGLSAALNYEFRINAKAKLTEDLMMFENLDDTDDWRINSITALTAGFTDNLALKVSYTVLHSNEPPVRIVPGTPDALYTFEETDTILTAALVVNF
jgi:putative salt-induced outer membrane protein YdiY